MSGTDGACFEPRASSRPAEEGRNNDPTTIATLADARAILASRDAIFAAPVRPPPSGDTGGVELIAAAGRDTVARWMWGAPVETHARLRRAVAPALSAATVAGIAAETRVRADALLRRDGIEKRIDLVGDYARPLVRDALYALIGVAPARWGLLEQQVARLVVFLDGGGAHAKTVDYFAVAATAQTVAEAWAGPLPDRALAARSLLRAVADGELSHDEAVAQAVLLLVGNSYTTADALGGILARLCAQPELWAALRAGTIDASAAIEEGLRLGPPTHMVLRRRACAAIATPSGTVRAGEEVLIPLDAVNRDPAAFADSDRFDPARAPARHLAFGAGRHLCSGAHLARMLLRAGIEALVARLPEWPAEVDRVDGPSPMGGSSVLRLSIEDRVLA